MCNLCRTFFSTHIYFPPSGQAVVAGVVPSPPRFSLSIFIAHRVQQSHRSSTFHRVLLTHSRSRAFRKSICAQEKVITNVYEYALGGIRTHEPHLDYNTGLEGNNLIRHRGDRLHYKGMTQPAPVKRHEDLHLNSGLCKNL